MKKKLKSLYYLISGSRQQLNIDYPVDMKPRYGHGLPGHHILEKILSERKNDYRERMLEFLGHREVLWNIKMKIDTPSDQMPYWDNGFFPGLDMVVLYGMLAKYKPSVFLEVGSGNSTKLARYCVDHEQLETSIVSIDPKPRAAIEGIADDIKYSRLEETDVSIFNALGENDILFIDNSHRILPNSDCTVFFLEILPLLRPGVIVQIHDVYLPWDYPPEFCERAYSEQYGLAVYLLHSTKYRVLLPNYFVSQDKELSSVMRPMWDHEQMDKVERHGGSFWFRVI